MGSEPHITPMIDTDASQRIERLMPLVDAITLVERLVEPLAPRRMARGAAFGRTLASPVTVASALPPHAIALRDGVALRAEATLDASSYAPVAVAATPVETGDALPAEADAVVPSDALDVRGKVVHVVAPVAPGDGVLPVDGDVAAGELSLRRPTRRLRAVDLAVLAIARAGELAARAAHPYRRRKSGARCRSSTPSSICWRAPSKVLAGITVATDPTAAHLEGALERSG